MEISGVVKPLFLLLILHLHSSVNAQDAYVDPNKPKVRTGYFELAGSGGLGSFNYEKEWKQKPLFDIHFRVGFSIAPIDRNNGSALVFPVMLHFTHGKSKHKLDFGIGQSLSITTKGSFFLLTPVSIGYRLEPENKKHFWRFSYTPLVSYLVDFQWQHWGGITWGIKF